MRTLLRSAQGIVVLVMLLACAGFCSAQVSPPLSHQAWSTEEGLPDASVHGIVQARNGYIWIATEAGAARFDGNEFTVYRHLSEPAFASDDVRAVAQDRNGDLWFGTSDGLVQLRVGRFTHLTMRGGPASNRIVSLAATEDGTLLVLSDAGLGVWNGANLTPLATGSDHPVALQPLSEHAIEVVTTKEPWLYLQGSLHSASSRLLEGLRSSRNGLAWSFDAHSFSLVGAGVHRTLHAGEDVSAPRILTAQLDREGRAWIGTNHGLFLFLPGSATRAQAVPSLGSEAILSLCEDREGNMWVGTEASGLHVLRPRKFHGVSASAGEVVTAVAGTSTDTAWYGTRDGGLHLVRNDVESLAAPLAALTSPVILSLALGQHGDLWAGTPDGLNHISSSGVQRFTSADGLPDDFVRSLLVDSHDVLWAGTRGGLARIERGRITIRTTTEGLGSDSVGSLVQGSSQVPGGAFPNDDLWIGTSDGLSHLHGQQIETFRPSLPQGGSIITAIAKVDSEHLLVAVHEAGLFFFVAGRFSALALPLSSDINSIVVDAAGFVWLRGAHSLSRIPLAQLKQCSLHVGPCRAVVNSFNTADGLPNDVAAAEGTPQLSLTPAGTLWVSTRKGLATADLAQLPINSTPPPVLVQRFSVDGAELPLGSGQVTVAPGHNRFLFNFVALSYTLPAKVRYRYRLEGFDHDWIDAGSLRVASYTSLPSREYRFVVQAQNNDGIWDSQDAVVLFRVLPPLYRRWWFALLMLVLAAAFTMLLVQLRERVVQRRFNVVLAERNRLAREIHDTLAQDFVSISLQLDIASSLLKSKQAEAAMEQLQSTRVLIKEGLQAARQSIWDLRASAGEDSLPTRLSTLVGKYRFGGAAPKVSIGGAFRKLPPALESEVLRITQESLANASRHAAASEVSVTLFYHPEHLQLTMQDNGQGFLLQEVEARPGHYGLRGLRERAAGLGGELMIASSPGEGTTVSLSVPLGKESLLA